MKAIVINQNGGPEQLVYQDYAEPTPKAGEAVVRLEAIGVNYIDTYHRTGLYKTALPLIPGMEGAGTVSAVGADVKNWKAGDRVIFGVRPGAFADLIVFDPAQVRDTATYAKPQTLAEGVSDVLVNGVPVMLNGAFTDAAPGQVLRKR